MLRLENGGTRQSRHFGLSIRASDTVLVQVDRYGHTLDSDPEFVGTPRSCPLFMGGEALQTP